MSKSYFRYLLKSQKHSIIFLAIINIIGLMVSYTTFHGGDRIAAAIICSFIIAVILTFVSGPVLFRVVDDRKAVDTFFPIGVRRQHMLNTILLFAIMITVVPFVVDISVTALLQVIWKTKYAFDYLRFAAPMILALIGLTVFNSCTFLLANSLFDGIVTMIAYTVMPYLFYMMTGTFFSECIYGYSPDYSIFTYMSLFFHSGMNAFLAVDLNTDAISYVPWIIGSLAYIVIGYYGAFRNFVNRKNERAESISDEPLSYPGLILIYSAGLIMTVAFVSGLDELSFVLYFLIFIAYTVANFVYKRKIKIQLKSILFFIGMIALAVILSTVAFKTKGFGLSYGYDHHPTFARISYSAETNQDPGYKELIDSIKEKEQAEHPYMDFEFGTISFEMQVTDRSMNGYDQIMDILNRYRDASIKNHYEGDYHSMRYEYLVTNSWLSIYQDTNGLHRRASEYSNYQDSISVADLLIIDRYSPVYIRFNYADPGYRISNYLPAGISF
ncbi:MAG: hypothetical protein II704_04135 [Erysipelotrichaceae bacterium]|nr:hypothetical protein [Erysipelotrichaceae bacterium]